MTNGTQPVLEFVLAVLDADSLDAVARVSVEQIVSLFGAASAVVRDEHVTWAQARGTVDRRSSLTTLSFRLTAAEEAGVRLEIEVPRDPDLAIVRQQFLDLVAVIRRAWRDRTALEAERRRARRDELTGLENRRALEEHLHDAVALASEGDAPVTVMLLDLDHFKAVNDTFGHVAGDEVLRAAGAAMRKHLRHGIRACRWGGDEFLLALTGMVPDDVVELAEQIREAFRNDPRARGVTMTVGLADTQSLPMRAKVVALIDQADACLYDAKRRGRDRVTYMLPHRAVV